MEAVASFLGDGTQTIELTNHFQSSDSTSTLIGATSRLQAGCHALALAVPATVSLAFCASQPFHLQCAAQRPAAARLFSSEGLVALVHSGTAGSVDQISVARWPNEGSGWPPGCRIISLGIGEQVIDAQVYRDSVLIVLVSSGETLRLDMLESWCGTSQQATILGAASYARRGALLLPGSSAAALLVCSVKRGLAAVFVDGSKGVFCDLEAENEDD